MPQCTFGAGLGRILDGWNAADPTIDLRPFVSLFQFILRSVSDHSPGEAERQAYEVGDMPIEARVQVRIEQLTSAVLRRNHITRLVGGRERAR